MRLRQLLPTYLVLAGAWTSAYGQAGGNLEMTIHVYDYAGIDPGELEGAEAVAAGILHGAGIGTKWKNCRLSAAATAGGRCTAAAGDVTHLYIRLLPETMAGKLGAPATMLGLTLPTSRGSFPVDAYVFAERVGVFAGQDGDRLYPVLGAAITHEVGHLLLSGNAHTVTGIMSAHWGAKEKKDLLMGALIFSPVQSAQIRVDVKQRMSGSRERAPIAYDERAVMKMRGR